MKPLMIGLFGVSRVGKDTFADVIVEEFNALKVSQGDYIKRYFAPMLSLKERPEQFAERMSGKMDTDAFWRMYWDHGAEVVDFARSQDPENGVDAFTQEDRVKDRIRPLLEHGGYVILEQVEREMYDHIADYEGLVINSRLFDVPQCQAWRDRGGLVIELHKPGVGPKTDYERTNVQAVRDAGLVNLDLHNRGTIGEWQELARRIATHVMANAELVKPTASQGREAELHNLKSA